MFDCNKRPEYKLKEEKLDKLKNKNDLDTIYIVPRDNSISIR